MKRFNEDQLRALDNHLHCAVHANAGSGKTSVLTERFVRILTTTDAPLDSIVAITFTRAAAAEMRERIHRSLLALAAGGNTRAKEWVRQMSRANIVTFHSFCAGLVRQYADDIGLDADVRDMEEAESFALRSDSVSTALRSALQPTSALFSSVLEVFDELSTDTVRSILSSIAGSRSLREQCFRVCALSLDELLEERRIRGDALHRALIVRACHFLERDLRGSNFTNAAKGAEQCRGIRHNAETQSAPIEEIAKAFSDLCTKLFTQKYELKSALVTKDEKAAELSRKFVHVETVQATEAVLTVEWNPEREALHARITQCLYAMGLAAADEYTARKVERGAIDFDDMIGYVTDILADPDRANSVRGGLRYIMVDEFQDTDPEQFAVLQQLAPALSGVEAHSPNVFIVGDDKQSIYGFRDADVRLFRKATEAIAHANEVHADSGYRPLARSYRMHQDLCSAVNALCSSMFTGVVPLATEYEESVDVEYTPLVPGIEVPQSPLLGKLHVIETIGDEFSIVARTIASILNGTTPMDVAERDSQTGEWDSRRPLPQDFAILLPRNKDVVAMAAALRECGVPAFVRGGRAFFTRPEVADIRALLMACADPADDLASAVVLRSPLLRCTDAEITMCALAGRATSLRDGLNNLVASGDATPNLVHAHTMFHDWSARILSQPLSSFIQAVLQQTQWRQTLTDTRNYRQTIANVEKAIDIVRNAIEMPGAGIYDAIDALTPPDVDKEREGELEPDGTSVQVMTLHAAKGLEFNIVCVAGLRTKKQSGPTVTTQTLGITAALAPEVRTPEEPLKKEVPPPARIHALNSALYDQQQSAEMRRTLYVALTRGKMHVLVSLVKPKETSSDSLATSLLTNALSNVPASLCVRHGNAPSDARYTPQEQPINVVDLTNPLPVVYADVISPSMLVHRAPEATVAHESDGSNGMMYGTAVHAALAATVVMSASESTETAVPEIVRVLRNSQLDKQAVINATNEILALYGSTLFTNHITLLRQARIETRLVGALDQMVFQGILDVRLTHADGIIEVWDWKTNDVYSSEDVETLALMYAPQMATYAWLCLRAYPTAPAVRTRLVFTKSVQRGFAVQDVLREWSRQQMEELQTQLSAMATPAAYPEDQAH